MSRCKKALIILGDIALLRTDARCWAKILMRAEELDLIIDVHSYYSVRSKFLRDRCLVQCTAAAGTHTCTQQQQQMQMQQLSH